MFEHPSEGDLERYSRGELGEARTVVLEKHLLACEHCIEAIEAIEEYARSMRAGLQEL
jgi:anti-sigma factor ChrR (cupin superfamily)